ncbi:MAG: cell division protein FtsB [Shewanella sp.]|nr:cell division protein FtsB [Shewanella sp.]MCF1429459.1 cell division protein FtsB [Shewanella sp.]MCF1437452.1 cell division protein FtsB [Shewanella sp.]MCF1456650.1 cell division protein FtsB [Shewanella sp.]
MKRFLFVLLLLLGMLQYRLWFGENSLPEYFSLKQQIYSQIESNGKLIERNQVLREEISDLRRGTEALEERARNELGMVKKGETFYRVVGSEQSPSRTDN